MAKELITKFCGDCGNSFATLYSPTRYCSPCRVKRTQADRYALKREHATVEQLHLVKRYRETRGKERTAEIKAIEAEFYAMVKRAGLVIFGTRAYRWSKSEASPVLERTQDAAHNEKRVSREDNGGSAFRLGGVIKVGGQS